MFIKCVTCNMLSWETCTPQIIFPHYVSAKAMFRLLVSGISPTSLCIKHLLTNPCEKVIVGKLPTQSSLTFLLKASSSGILLFTTKQLWLYSFFIDVNVLPRYSYIM